MFSQIKSISATKRSGIFQMTSTSNSGFSMITPSSQCLHSTRILINLKLASKCKLICNLRDISWSQVLVELKLPTTYTLSHSNYMTRLFSLVMSTLKKQEDKKLTMKASPKTWKLMLKIYFITEVWKKQDKIIKVWVNCSKKFQNNIWGWCMLFKELRNFKTMMPILSSI